MISLDTLCCSTFQIAFAKQKIFQSIRATLKPLQIEHLIVKVQTMTGDKVIGSRKKANN